MGIKFTNNFVTTISAGINNSVTTIPITSATGFPSLGASDYAYCSLQKESPFTLEIVKVTAVSGTNLTVVRGQDGTSASAFNSGDAFELRVTAGGINDVVTTAGAALPKAGGAMTGAITTNSTFDGVDIAARDAVLTSTTTTAGAALPKAGGTMSGDLVMDGNEIHLADNGEIRLGNAADMKIYHDGNHSYILDNGIGALKLKGDDIRFEDADGNNILKTTATAAELYHSGTKKLETTAAGVDVAGTVTVNDRIVGNSNLLLVTHDSNEKIHLDASGYIKLETAGAEKMRITSAGNVHLNTGVDARVQLGTSGAGATSVSDNSVYVRGNDDDLILGAAGNGNISFKENADTRMFIKTGGNVGIGTASPGSYTGVQSNLEVKNASHGGIAINAGTNSLGMLAFAQNGTHKWSVEMENSATPYLSFNEAGTHRMTIDAGGNVGIGTTSPEHALQVITPGSTHSGIVKIGGSDASLGIEISYDQSSDTIASIIANPTYTNDDALLKIAVDGDRNANQLVLDGVGNVGIGTASPSASLDVVTNTDVWTGEFTQSNTSNGDGVLVEVGSTAAADYALSVRTSAGNHPAFNVKANGNVGIGIFSPLDILHLNDPNDDCVLNLDTAIANKNSLIKFSDPDAQGRGFIQYAHSDGSFRITVEGSERLRIASAGQIGIGGANYGTDGQVLTSTGASSAPAWEDAGGGGAYSAWVLKVSNYTASTGDQLICNSQSAFTVTLPASPSAGDTVIVKNVASGLITIGRNGSNINSAAADATMPIGNAAQLVYVASAIGWTVL